MLNKIQAFFGRKSPGAKIASFFVMMVGVAVMFMPSHVVHAVDITTFIPQVALFNIILYVALAFASLVIWMAGNLSVLILSLVIIPILQYNGFGDANIIAIGWPLVRDIVNMFVILILLLIAVRTILNMNGDKWASQLPKLFIAVVMVNFSKTITLAIVDFSQVVMMTFVNAVRDIAAGNFTKLFELADFLSLDYASEVLTGGVDETATLMGYAGTMYASAALIILMMIIFGILAVVFIYRIVMIWILVILAPAAFFFWGTKDIVGGMANEVYGKWWEKLIGAVTLGPVLVFFIWLSLATVSTAENIAESEGFPDWETSDSVSSFMTEALQMDTLLSMLVAIILMVVGMTAASSASGKMGGVAAKLVNKGTGEKMAKFAAGAPYMLGKRVAREGARQAEQRWQVGSKLGRDIGAEGGKLMGSDSKLAQLLGRQLSKYGGKLETAAGASTDAAALRASERAAERTGGERASITDAIAKGNIDKLLGFGVGAADDVREELFDIATNKDRRSKDKAALMARGMSEDQAQEQVDAAYKNAVQSLMQNEGNLGFDADRKKKLFEMKVANMHLIEGEGEDEVTREADRAKKVKELVGDDRFDTKMLTKDTLEAVANGEGDHIKEALRDQKTSYEVTENGEKVQKTSDLWERVSSGKGLNRKARDFATGSLRESARSEAVEKAIAEGDGRGISDAIQNGGIDIGTLSIEQFDQGGEAMVQAIMAAGVAGSLSDDVKTAFMAKMDEMEAAGRTDPAELDKARFEVTGDISHLGVQDDGKINPEMLGAVKDAIRNNPLIAQKLAQQVRNGATTGNEVTRELVSALSSNSLEKMTSDFYSADASDEQRTDIRKSLIQYRKALEAEMARAGTMAPGKKRNQFEKRVQDKQRMLDAVQRRIARSAAAGSGGPAGGGTPPGGAPPAGGGGGTAPAGGTP